MLAIVFLVSSPTDVTAAGGGAGGELHTFVRGGGFDVDGDGEVSFLEYREAILRGGLSTIAYREVCTRRCGMDRE